MRNNTIVFESPSKDENPYEPQSGGWYDETEVQSHLKLIVGGAGSSSNAPINQTEYSTIILALNRIESKHDVHSIDSTNEHNMLLDELASLQADNFYFREQLRELNTPFKLKKYSILFGMIAIISMLLDRLTGIYLIHPVLAYGIFAVSFTFFIMSKIMIYQDKKGE